MLLNEREVWSLKVADDQDGGGEDEGSAAGEDEVFFHFPNEVSFYVK